MLDGETEALLNGPLRAVGGRPSVEAIRQINLELGRTLGGAPEPVAAIEDRIINVGRRSLPVRLYWPEADVALPIILYCHGGGFVWGEPDGYDFLSRALAKECGALLLALDYRLAPEYPYPAALEDVEAGLQWAIENAEALGGDADRVAIAGDSAGGALTAVIAQRSRQSGRKLAAQMLLYPVLDATMSTRSYDDLAEGYYLTRSAMAWYWANYLRGSDVDRRDPSVSPRYASSLEGLPPTLILTASFDLLRDEALAYAGRLEAAGVSVEPLDYAGTIHGFLRFRGPLQVARDAARDIGAFARRTLSDPRGPV